MIDSTGLKVFGKGEWKDKKHGKERRRIWRKLHRAVNATTHELICADPDLSLSHVTDSEAFPGLIRQTDRKIRAAAADGLTIPDSATMNCDVKKFARLSLPGRERVTGLMSRQTATVLLRISV